MKKKIINILLSLFLFVNIFFYYDNSSLLEYHLVEIGISNWILSPLILKLIIVLEIFFSFSIILYNKKKITKITGIIVLFILIYDFFSLKVNEDAVIHKSLFISFSKVLLSNITFFIFIIITLFSVFFVKSNSLFKQKWVPYLVSIIAIVLTLIIAPPYYEDFIYYPYSNEIEQSFDFSSLKDAKNYDKYKDKLKKGDILLAFFSPSCYFCQMAARKIQISLKHCNNFPDSYAVFLGTDKDVDWFFKYTNTSLPFMIIRNNKQFFSVAGYSFPSLFLLHNGKIVRHLSGKTFNYKTVQLICNNNL